MAARPSSPPSGQFADFPRNERARVDSKGPRRLRRSSQPRFRRRAVASLLVVAAALAAAFVYFFWWRASSQGPIILVSIDTLRADHLPVYGYKGVSTPAIDALVADGVIFERAYSHSPQTLPSHTSIFSGRLPLEHGVRDNVGFTVKTGERLLPQILRGHRFVTAGFASAFVLRKASGINQGFDVYDSEMPPAAPDASMGMVQRDGAATLALAEKWLAGQKTRRLFLFVHFYEPHKPYRPPARYASRHASRYDGEIAYADELVGRLVRVLKDRDLYDAATIVLLSDHGEGLGDHGEQEHGVFLYEESIHVPLIIKLPGGRSARRRVSSLAQHIDIVPTLLDLLGLPPLSGIRGHSLRAVMAGRGEATSERAVYSEAMYPRYHFGWNELYALTDAGHRYIRAPRPELYDLQRDPNEKQNVHDSRARTAASMHAALETFIAGRKVERPSIVSEEELEKFRALGYLGAQPQTSNEVSDASIDPKDKIEVLEAYREATTLRADRRFAEAATLLERIVQENPTMLDVWIQLAKTLMRMGRTADAVEALKRVVALKPESTESLLGIATALTRLGRLDEARKHAELAVSRDAAKGHEALARIALAAGHESEALEHARRAQQADPKLPMPLYIQGLALYTRGKYAEALPLFQRALQELRPRNLELTELHFYTADTLGHLERYAEAEQEFREELRRFPENSKARASLALLYFAQAQSERANRELAELIRTTPVADSYALVARTLDIAGEREAAGRVVMKGLRDFPHDRALKAMVR